MSQTLYTLQSDIDLARRCREGDRKGQEEFYNRFKSRMMAVCMRYMGGKEQASDVFQEAFIKAFRLMANYRGEGPIEAWLRKIVVSCALNELKKRKMVWLEDVSDGFVLNPEFNGAINHLNEQELLKLIAELPRGYRTVFNLYVLEGFDHREIAQSLGITESTSRTQLLKARVLLQKKILGSDTALSGKLHKMRS